MTPQEQINRIPIVMVDAMPEIIVHANCPDGLASAMILSDIFYDAQITFVAHNTPEHRSEPRRAIWCDMAPPAETARGWVDADAVVLDHHATARDVVQLFGNRGVFADEHKHPGVSGAVLAWLLWERFAPDPARYYGGQSVSENVRDFATLAGIRDTWQTKDNAFEVSCHQAAALMLFGESLVAGTGHPPWLYDDEMRAGAALYADTQARARKVAETAPIVECAGLLLLVFNDGGAMRLTSDAAEQARAIGRRCDAVCGFYYTNEGDLVISLRAVSDVDVGAIAKLNGGGGHRAAAGCKIANWSGSPYAAARLLNVPELAR